MFNICTKLKDSIQRVLKNIEYVIKDGDTHTYLCVGV